MPCKDSIATSNKTILHELNRFFFDGEAQIFFLASGCLDFGKEAVLRFSLIAPTRQPRVDSHAQSYDATERILPQA